MKTLCVVLLVLGAGCLDSRTPSIYQVPDGFRGWVTVEYERPECPPLPEHDGALWLSIPADGRLCTSSKMLSGWASDKFYYVAGRQRRLIPATASRAGGQVWGGVTTTCGTGDVERAAVFQQYFIGPEADLEHSTTPDVERCGAANRL